MTDIDPIDRQRIIEDIQSRNVMGQETLGMSIRRLRLEITGLDQATFAAMCKMSTKALYQLENDKGNPTLKTLNDILRLFGMRMTLGALTSSLPTMPEESEPLKKRGARPSRRGATPPSHT